MRYLKSYLFESVKVKFNLKYLESFSKRRLELTPEDWQPKPAEVKIWEDYLDKNYTNFSKNEFGKMIQIDDKSYFMNNKGDISTRIFRHITDNVRGKIHTPSLKRAIKNWIDRNNI